MKKIFSFFKKNIVLFVSIILIFYLIFFPLKTNKSNYIVNGLRENFILDKDKILEQSFTLNNNNLKKVSLFISTVDYNNNCSITSKIYDKDNKLIAQQEINNMKLSKSVEYFDITVNPILDNIKGNEFKLIVYTNCDNLIKVQLYDSLETDSKAIYDAVQINKSVAIKCTGEENSKNNIYYFVFIVISSLLINAIGGNKNDKK